MAKSFVLAEHGGSLREARKDFTRGQIRAAANDVFVRRGYAHATMEEIARVAGIRRSTLYTYYPDKEALLSAIAERYIVDVREVVLRLPGPVPSFSQIQEWLTHFVSFIAEERTPTELMRAVGHDTDVPEPCRIFGRELLRALASKVQAFEKALTPGQGIMLAWANAVLWNLGDAVVFRTDNGDTQEARDRLFVAASLLHRFARGEL